MKKGSRHFRNESPPPKIVATASEVARLRVAIQYAIDALEGGDQWAACDLLVATLEGQAVMDTKAQTPCPLRCGFAGWPGLVEEHVRTAHSARSVSPARVPRGRLLRAIPPRRARTERRV